MTAKHKTNARKTNNLGPNWSYTETLSPPPHVHDSDIFSTPYAAPTLSSRQSSILYQSTVFTKDNVQSLGYHNVAKQIRDKLRKTTQVPTCEIRMKNVSYTVPTQHLDNKIPTLVSSFRLPSFQKADTNDVKHILKNINAIFKPGTMTLVLGPPGCGKTTLLKHLAGILHVKGKEELKGSVTYNGCKANQIDLSSLAAYVQQSDNHYPTLTVKETFEFSHQCLVGKIDPNDPLAVNEQHMVDILISVFGLTECADTIIGDEMIRGVSGGQKRRVTVGEMMTGRATTLLLDEFSNGLDASTTYDIAKAVRTMAEVLEKTVVMTMLQPPPEVYDLFDNILVLDQGEVVYNGPRTTLPSYFRSIGFACLPRKDIADFLQEVTTHLGPRFATDDSTLTKLPRSPSEFAVAFERSSYFASLNRELAAAGSLTWRTPPTLSKRALSFVDGFKVVFGRTWKASMRDARMNRSRLLQALVLGTVVGTVGLSIGRNSNPHVESKNVPMKLNLFFLTILFQALATISSADAIIARRAVLYKQTAFNFFDISSYAIAEAILELFWTALQVTLYGATFYFSIGYDSSATSFVTFLVLIHAAAATYAQLFKLSASCMPDAVSSKALSMFCFFLHTVFCGLVQPEASIPSAWLWLFWSSPMAWTLRALCQNEFLSPSLLYETKVPQMTQHGTVLVRLGDSALHSVGMSTNSDYIWGGIVFMWGYFALLVTLTALSYKYVRVRGSFSSAPDQDDNDTDAGVAIDILESKRGVNSLPFEPVTLSFQDLKYTISIGKGKNKTTRQLLKGIHGCFQPGSLTALMGSTGAGKTTLMDVIAGRKTAGVIEGDMFVNGHPLVRQTFTSVSGYCEQTDLHEETSTIREAFHFSAALRLPSDTTAQRRESFVEDILDVLELTSKANAQYSTLSQGERKRVTIGVELLSNPSILFLDEPTTGLDSRAATIVMECIKRIAESGRTVVCTIHQPSTVLFELFDKLLLLKSGGELVYFGDLGPQSSSLLGYFGQFQGLAPMETRENPATYMLNCIGAGTGKAKIDVDFAAAYFASSLGAQNKDMLEYWSQAVHRSSLPVDGGFKVPLATQFKLLLERQWVTYWRSPSYNISRGILVVMSALIFASCFHGMEVTSTIDVMGQLAVIFVPSTFLCTFVQATSASFVSRRRNLFYRENLSRMYAPLAHSLSLAAVEFVYCTVLSVVFFVMYYWLVGLSTAPAAAAWFFVSFAVNLVLWSYLGHVLAYALPSVQIALLIGGGLSSVLFIFSGFLIDGHSMSSGWEWMYWVSPMHYMLETMYMAQFHGQTASVLDTFTNRRVQIDDFVVSYFNGAFSHDNLWRDLGVLVAMVVFLQLCLWRSMAKINHMKR